MNLNEFAKYGKNLHEIKSARKNGLQRHKMEKKTCLKLKKWVYTSKKWNKLAKKWRKLTQNGTESTGRK